MKEEICYRNWGKDPTENLGTILFLPFLHAGSCTPYKCTLSATAKPAIKPLYSQLDISRPYKVTYVQMH